jgi:hypothetical protein
VRRRLRPTGTMTITEALDLVISRTGVERYRYLCLEHPKPKVRAEYCAHVLRLAAQPPAPEPTAAELVAFARKVRVCPFRSIDSNGCGCARCGLRGGARVSNLECIQCMRTYP